ncbi:MAG: peptidylprolyl isomerase [Hyphomicrobiaceae bacterium]|nr:MAG: peptidylprolyl isomerase [Hyphomicrobiaceae bacterium]
MSCSARSAIVSAARTPVTVNGVAIPHDAISREAQNHPAPTPIGAWTAAARALVVRELLLQEARRLGLHPQPAVDDDGRTETEEEALVRGLVEREVATPVPDEDTCRRYYDQNRRRFRSADIYEASHILIAARRDQPAAFAAARERARTVIARVLDGTAQFRDLAIAYSDCPSAASGGNLGQLTAGDTTPKFEAALCALQPGEMTREPVETDYGLHIIRLDRHIAGRDLPFAAVRTRIAGYLAERTRRTAVAQYVARLASRASLSGIELPTPADLRVH